ncbi:MAG: hypothetical protein VKS61_05235 [Candidatus Sericytochromatia bacterium]|nr:hypothetical protein [Candidatus Sericytochromatia bacterium]
MPVAPFSPARPIAPIRRPAAVAPGNSAAPAEAARPPAPKVQAQQQPWTVGRVLGAAGVGTAGFVGGSVATFVVDLLFHFGNNGGVAWPGGVYLAAAGLVAAGAMALYARATAK